MHFVSVKPAQIQLQPSYACVLLSFHSLQKTESLEFIVPKKCPHFRVNFFFLNETLPKKL